MTESPGAAIAHRSLPGERQLGRLSCHRITCAFRATGIMCCNISDAGARVNQTDTKPELVTFHKKKL